MRQLMKAVILKGYREMEKLEYAQVPKPIPQPGKVLIKLVASSILPKNCGLKPPL
ncbi:MAG: hypothetical protein F6K34_12475 [Okeania sp. SIO4D6]|uniref:hypothetical protein n=2 Tax=Oscillatoriales TaxID=1150 RepID=UPI0013BB1F8E|nr:MULTISPECIES: hypothetical protein [unclassified Okeania]NEP05564.1 hypothetical protein [Okeania sp. SIO4D6]NEP38932.1 hypothetical protein [Okeania sp. SIO2H7]NEP95556.1 hypothetical protein [Okeania sp. SIO2F5]